jgi:pimeloyl-ACP methyl ester carboxylesterase
LLTFSISLEQDVLKLYADNDCFFLVAHSFGSLLTLELAKTLEAGGRIGNVVMIDGSPLFFKRFTESLGSVDAPDEAIQHEILKTLIRIDFPGNYPEVMATLTGQSWEQELENFLKIYVKERNLNRKYSKDSIVGLFNRMKMSRVSSEASFPFLQATKISLVVPSEKLVNDITENYDLNRYSSQSVEVLTVNGNHLSILQSADLSNFINSFN